MKITDNLSKYQIFYTVDNCEITKRYKTMRGWREYLNKIKPSEWSCFEIRDGFHSTTQTEYLVAHNNPFYGEDKKCLLDYQNRFDW